jgi:DNA transformation protein
MAVTPGFADFVSEQLAGCGPIYTKRMFGGVGIYCDDVFFAIIDDDVLYLKTDASNRADFARAGAAPFRPSGEAGATLQYYSVPVSILEDADRLTAWARKAVAVALAASARRKTVPATVTPPGGRERRRPRRG